MILSSALDYRCCCINVLTADLEVKIFFLIFLNFLIPIAEVTPRGL